MNKEQMGKIADDIFKRYPRESEVFVTSDGQAFFNKAFANNHAANNRIEQKLELKSFLRKSESTIEDPPVENTNDVIAEIKAAETVGAVKVLLAAEKAGDNREMVIDAAEKRITALTDSITGGNTTKPANDVIAEIKAAETVEAVKVLLAAEKAGDNRKTVVDAAEKRIIELSNPVK